MTLRTLLALSILTALSSTAMADGGTPEQRAACRPDVRRFCNKLPPGAGDFEFQACLQAHHDRITPKCRVVLDGR
jgi:hypothetical protein